ncbi:carboxylesterase, type b [Grosmannia clavigera kw1407]|uniref:Carboxylic ester hydrolase n=1 Tax=Grosmannia clavigera (strain kw1407 / UAMH 11150) TaxID=655863 RepID=F0X6Y5_GROCL|nr:carboxylesterase, type b [Grosmannia clavigera kw1407]EFX06469.1 carboxylesterase, type b [Grosmannia clavigera kw1407]
MRGLCAAVAVASLLGACSAHPALRERALTPDGRAPGELSDHPALKQRTPGPLEERSVVNVAYPDGTAVGLTVGSIDSFRAIPFAQPPVGDLRLRPPLKPDGPLGQIDATQLLGPSCPQMLISTGSNQLLFDILGDLVDVPIFEQVGTEQEDCLTLNVQRPAGTTSGAKLPVLVWFFGGGFELGSNAIYDGSDLIDMGVSIGQPFLFVAINSRVNGFGFLGGSALKAEGSTNLGLLDQRLGLQWTADNIAAFGGDPDKVTIWGESAGSISVLDQMVLFGGNNTYNGKPLFRGAIMDSGSIVPADPIDGSKAQAIFDSVAAESGCGAEADDAATLACLRACPYATFQKAVNSAPAIFSYNSLALSYLPRPDGTVLTDSPDQLVLSNKYAAVPMIIGDQEDEGTLFAILPINVTDTASTVEYLSSLYFHDATKEKLTEFVETYPDDPSAGSPFRTGVFNELRPGFKRLAAILGDLTFNLSRRAFLAGTSLLRPDVPSWSYLASYDYGTPILGTFHATDLLQVFYGVLPNYASKNIQTYYINFVTNLDPNVGHNATLMAWPQWSAGQNLMQFFNDHASLLADSFRSASYNFIVNNIDIFRI